jgi:hypothetical protein
MTPRVAESTVRRTDHRLDLETTRHSGRPESRVIFALMPLLGVARPGD